MTDGGCVPIDGAGTLPLVPIRSISCLLRVQYAGGVRSVHAIEHGGQRQKASALVVILGFLGNPTQVGG